MYAGEVLGLFSKNGGKLLEKVSFELTHLREIEIFVNNFLAEQLQSPSKRLSLKDLNGLRHNEINEEARAICFCIISFGFRILSNKFPGPTCLVGMSSFRNNYPVYAEGKYAKELHYLCNLMSVARTIFKGGNCKGMVMEAVALICGSIGGKRVLFKCGGGMTHGVKREFPLLTFYESELTTVEFADLAVFNEPRAPFTEVTAHSVEPIPLNVTGQKRSGSFEEMPAEFFLRPRHTASVVSASLDMDAIGEELDPNDLSEWLATDPLAETPVVLPANPASAADFSHDCMSSPDSTLSSDIFTSGDNDASLFGATDDESEFSYDGFAKADGLFAVDDFPVSDGEEQELLRECILDDFFFPSGL